MPRKVDKNSIRGGAGISAVVLFAAFLIDTAVLVPVVCAALAIGAIFGLRASPLGASFRALKKALRLNVAVELEDEPPPRFAQTLGAAFLAASVAAFALDARPIAWVLALLVAALQTLLAVTGICIGCEMYLLGKRLSSRGAHA